MVRVFVAPCHVACVGAAHARDAPRPRLPLVEPADLRHRRAHRLLLLLLVLLLLRVRLHTKLVPAVLLHQ